jgi:amidohydrolase family protein
MRADRYDELWDFKDTPFAHAFAAVVNARKTLEAGFTTVRDVGSEPFLAVDLRKAIDEGLVPGPRVVASGPDFDYGRAWRAEQLLATNTGDDVPGRTGFLDCGWPGADPACGARASEIWRIRGIPVIRGSLSFATFFV